jgi:hypothetical protein
VFFTRFAHSIAFAAAFLLAHVSATHLHPQTAEDRIKEAKGACILTA